MTDENSSGGSVNITVPTDHITLEEVFGPQFEKMDMAKLYRVAEGDMIQFPNFKWPEWRKEIGLLARHYYNRRRASEDAKAARKDAKAARMLSIIAIGISIVVPTALAVITRVDDIRALVSW